jgi:signal transduction histidine kinase
VTKPGGQPSSSENDAAALATPTLIAGTAILVLAGVVIFLLARPPSASDIENDLWTAWISLTTDDADRTFADMLLRGEREPANALLESLGSLSERDGRRFVIPTQIRFLKLFLEGQSEPFAEWHPKTPTDTFQFDRSLILDADWKDRKFPIFDPRSGKRIGMLHVSYQFYYTRGGLSELPRVRQLRQQDLWLMILVGGLALLALLAAIANILRIRERTARLASQQATIDLARQMCHELRNGLWAFSLEGRNLRHFFEVAADYLEQEPKAFSAAAESLGLDSNETQKFRRRLLRRLAEVHSHPETDVEAARNLATQAYAHIEGFGKYLQLTVEELDRHLLGREALRKPEDLSVTELWRESCALLSIRLRTAGVTTTETSEGSDVIHGDRRDLIHVFVNVIKNAIEAMGQETEPREINFRSRPVTGGVEIAISNNGPPIPTEIRHQIFETGFTTKSGGGRGRGLALVRSLVVNAGGLIQVLSGELKGVTFLITLPKGTSPGSTQIGDSVR